MKKKLTGTSFISRRHRASQRGQTMIFVVLGLSLVFLAVLGFTVDFGDESGEKPVVSADGLGKGALDLLAELTAVHQTLFRGGVTIVEGLANLDQLHSTEVEFIALPLRLIGGDGCPVRAIAVEGDSATVGTIPRSKRNFLA